jgi:uncharacterized membrane protein YdjX (TVP38/TMEM64 family)
MDKAALKRWGLLIGIIALVVLAVCAFFAWEFRDEWIPLVVQARDQFNVWLQGLRSHPILFFTIMAVVPIVPVPMSLFYLACGAFPTPVALAGILIALPINFALTYWLSVTLLRPLAEKLLARANLKIPQLSSRRNGILFSIFIRICGTPYALQNYIIPLARVNFRDYMLFGLPFQYIPAIAMMFLGDSLLHGKAMRGVMAIGILIAVAVAAKLGKDYLDRRKAAQSAVTNDATTGK